MLVAPAQHPAAGNGRIAFHNTAFYISNSRLLRIVNGSGLMYEMIGRTIRLSCGLEES